MKKNIITTTVETPTGSVTINARSWAYHTYREMNTKPRVYVHVTEDFDVLEDLTNRYRRPSTAWRKAARQLIAESGLNIDLTEMRWSQTAGCGCGCSPGFIINRQAIVVDGTPVRGFDVHVTLEAGPTVNEAKAPRQLELMAL